MKVTIDLDDLVLAEAKLLAQQSGRTLTAVIEEALRERIMRRGTMARREPVRLPTFGGQGLLPGADLDSSVALRDLMDEDPHLEALPLG
ncbi:MAG: DUF2191 domain-containing protein [Chloroflexota bacterium]|nr:MAG: DUF2191 domain-containing protein [Chloroflexota bacterium]